MRIKSETGLVINKVVLLSINGKLESGFGFLKGYILKNRVIVVGDAKIILQLNMIGGYSQYSILYPVPCMFCTLLPNVIFI